MVNIVKRNYTRIKHHARAWLKKAWIRWSFGSLVVVLSLVLLIKVGGYFLYVEMGFKRIDDKQEFLLYQTDHRAVLSACRTLMKQHNPSSDRISYQGDDLRLPPAIRSLGAHWLW